MTFVESNETTDVKIEDLKPLQKRLNVVFQVIEQNEEREINSRSGETHRVCDFVVGDETGIITLTLWNEDIDAMEQGKVFKLENGFVNIFRNSMRLSKGKFGSISPDDTVIDDIDEENDRSADHVDDPRRRSFGSSRSYGSSSSYGSSRSYGSSYGGGRDRRSSSSRRW